MKGDFSRFTFDPDKNYVETLMQQGRVQLDADWNEQQAMHRHHRERAVSEIIGPFGAPKQGGGFAIGTTPNGSTLTISSGSFYVDGIRVNNTAAQVTLATQPFLPPKQGNLAGYRHPAQSGRYVVYLEVWERHITGDRDPAIIEKALGGVDTATRKQLVWQVKLTRQPVAANAHCGQFGPGWSPPENNTSGTMKAETVTVGTPASPCEIPPSAGFRGLENQLYRVEIHRGGQSHGGAQPATFKWSRDNGTVTTTVSVSGQTLTARDLGRDDISLGFAANQWIEIIDERMELTHQHGELLRIESVNPNTREIKIKASTPVPPVDSSKPVVIRRWDNLGNQAGDNGIGLSSTPLVLESGLQVEFAGGTYRSGDYWLIPARTAINSETGIIEWQVDPNNNQPLSVGPHGPARRYCALALVDYDHSNDRFTVVGDADCRPGFPSLTNIAAEDVDFDSSSCNSRNMLDGADTVQEAIDALCMQIRGCCTYLITPQTDIKQVVDAINSQGKVNVKICFQAGNYQIDQPLVIGAANNPKGHIVVTGFGKGTRLHAPDIESCLRFDSCDSVTVRDLSAVSGRVGKASDAEHLNGTLTFFDCGEVDISDCDLRCGSSAERGATCISAVQSRTTGLSGKQVRIARNRLRVGMEQAGILVHNASQIWIRDNYIAAVKTLDGLTLDKLVKNDVYRARARSLLVSHARYQGDPPKDMTNMETIVYGNGQRAYFKTQPDLLGQWSKLISSLGSMPPTALLLKRRLEQLANMVLMATINLDSFPAFKQWRATLASKTRPVASQGLLICGSANNGYSWVNDNYISGVLQGIRIGYSRRENRQGNEVKAAGVNISGNRVQMHIPLVVSRHIEGIFAGSFSNELLIESNTVHGAFIAPVSSASHSEGIKVYGMLGGMLIVRHNQVASVSSAVRIKPLNGMHRPVHRWLVADNLLSGSLSRLDLSGDMSIDQIGNQPQGMSYRDLDNRLKALESRM